MKVAFIASDNNRSSGAFISMVNLASQLNKMGVENVIIIPKKGAFVGPLDGIELLEEYNLKYYVVNSITWVVPMELKTGMLFKLATIRHRFVNFVASKQLDKILKKEKVDVIHINTSYSYFATISAKRLKMPLIWHIREFLEEDQNVRIYYPNKGKDKFNVADRIITISNSIYNKYKSIFDISKMRVIFNGIDEKKFYNNDKSIFDSEVTRISYVGGISKGKGVYDIIDAVKNLGKCDSKFTINIIGRGTEYNENELKKQILDSELENVKFLGHTSNVKEVYDNSDIILVTSRAEAFGRVTVEAMLAGCLVIGANSAGTGELIADNETGYLYTSMDTNNFANVIKLALEDKDKSKQIAKRGQEYMLNNMTATQNAKNIYNLYDEVLREREGR